MIAKRMKELRETLELSMPEFGRRLGCSRDVIANIEYGRVEAKEVLLNHVCDIYAVRKQWLFEGQGAIFEGHADNGTLRQATDILRSLSPDLQEMALSQLQNLQKLMEKRQAEAAAGLRESLDTIRLMAAMMEAQDYHDLPAQEGRVAGIGRQLQNLIEEKNITFEQILASCRLDVTELGAILEDSALPRRDDLIMICLILQLSVEEAQRLLTAAGMPALYPKNRRDSACIFALMKGLAVGELNELLAELEEAAI